MLGNVSTVGYCNVNLYWYWLLMFINRCVQYQANNLSRLDPPPGLVEDSEDCLTINVYTKHAVRLYEHCSLLKLSNHWYRWVSNPGVNDEQQPHLQCNLSKGWLRPLTTLLPSETASLQDMSNKKPVLFWIHGGSFIMGSAVEWGVDGILRQFVSRDVVFVSVQYRLGPLGESTYTCK